MGLAKLTKSRGYKNFMAKLYGIGASVVIMGALFKINHYNGADIMLILGLTTESIIFFFSAFEPPHVEPDWSLVYPELAGLYHGEKEMAAAAQQGSGSITDELDKMLSEANIDTALISSLGSGLNKLNENTANLSSLSDAGKASEKLTRNMETAAESVENLSGIYNKQAETIKNDIDQTSELSEAVKAANESIAGLTNVYKQASETMSKDLSATDAFAKSIQETTQQTHAFNEQYKKSIELLRNSTDAIDFSSLKEKNYGDQLEKLSDNLASLNAVYELQLQNSKSQAETTNQLQVSMTKLMETLSQGAENSKQFQEKLSSLNEMYQTQIKHTSDQSESSVKMKASVEELLNKLNESAEKTIQYNAGLDELSKKVADLNRVYGNMLSAMNVKS